MKYLGYFAVICWLVEITTAVRYPNWDAEEPKPKKRPREMEWGAPSDGNNYCKVVNIPKKPV